VVIAALRDAGCVFAQDEADLLIEAAASEAELARLLQQRITGAPLEQILGWAQFYGLRVQVNPGVFVPRRRTEALVDAALPQVRGHAPAVVVDLCCGSGAVGVALLVKDEQMTLHAVDIDPAAVACAQRNLGSARAHVYQGDLFAPLPRRLIGTVDLVIANPPYVPSHAVDLLPPEARDHEPAVALDGGVDGLDVIRQVANEATSWLTAAGVVLVESSQRQAPTVMALFAQNGLTSSLLRSDDLDATVVMGQAAH
jgi:release factor glutamine methyltransferase